MRCMRLRSSSVTRRLQQLHHYILAPFSPATQPVAQQWRHAWQSPVRGRRSSGCLNHNTLAAMRHCSKFAMTLQKYLFVQQEITTTKSTFIVWLFKKLVPFASFQLYCVAKATFPEQKILSRTCRASFGLQICTLKTQPRLVPISESVITEGNQKKINRKWNKNWQTI